jgi:hypothetical protein
MAAGNTYTQIASTTLGSNSATVTFSSISGIYTDLVLVIVGANVSGGRVRYTLNSDSGSNYSRTNLTGNGSSAASYRGSNTTFAEINVIASAQTLNAPFTIISSFNNYSNATTNKTILNRFGTNDSTEPGVEASVNLWRNTAAITSIGISAANGNLLAGSTFNLYGITAA